MLGKFGEQEYLTRMECGLRVAATVAKGFVFGAFQVIGREGTDVVTEADYQINQILRETLLKPGEGWLSEQDPDDGARLGKDVVWVVDPVDGTRELVDGIPEWCISVGLVVDGIPVVGGLCNPVTGEIFLGSLKCGVTYNNKPAHAARRTKLEGAVVLASRQEYVRGEWGAFENRNFSIRPTGSIAYKLAQVSASLADATWTLTPKHEWDVAAGVALVRSAGGRVHCLNNEAIQIGRAHV